MGPDSNMEHAICEGVTCECHPIFYGLLAGLNKKTADWRSFCLCRLTADGQAMPANRRLQLRLATVKASCRLRYSSCSFSWS